MRGIVSKMRFVALLFPCLVVATATSQAQSSTGVAPVVSFTTATFNLVTKPKAAVAISLGTDSRYLVTARDRVRASHHITVGGLSPNTPYYGTLVITPVKGKSKTVRIAAFQTLAPGAIPATVTNSAGKLLLNGRPALLLLGGDGAYNPCPSEETLTGTAKLGVSIFDASDSSYGCPDGQPAQWAQSLHSRLNGLWWRERDTTAEQQLRSQGLAELIGWQAGVQVISSPSPQAFENPCLSSSRLFDGVSQAAKAKAVVFRQSLASHPILPSRDTCTTPANLSMAFWTVIAAGGRGIEYSTRDAGHGSDFDVSNELKSQAAKLAAQMATLGPAVLTGKKVSLQQSPAGAVRYVAWQYGGAYYIIGVNTDNNPETSTFSGTFLTRAKTAQVMWENRNLRMAAGKATDSFAAQAVHIYKVQMPLK